MRRIVPSLALVLVLAGCGSSGGGSSDGAQTPKQTFAGTCGSCHALADAGTGGSFGPNLDQLRPDRARVLAAIKAGPGGMPAGLLDGDRAQAVAGYVSRVAGR